LVLGELHKKEDVDASRGEGFDNEVVGNDFDHVDVGVLE